MDVPNDISSDMDGKCNACQEAAELFSQAVLS